MWETAFLIITGVSQKVIGKIHYNLHFCQKIHNTVKHQLCFCTYVCIFEWNCTVCHMSTYGKRSTLFWKTRNCYCGGNVCRILATMWKMRKTDKSIFFFPFQAGSAKHLQTWGHFLTTMWVQHTDPRYVYPSVMLVQNPGRFVFNHVGTIRSNLLC